MGTDDEAVEVVDKLRVAGLGTRNCEIRRGTAIKLTKFANLHFRQPAQARAVLHRQQVLEALPVIFFLFEETVEH